MSKEEQEQEKTLKRGATMAATAEEGLAFLEKEGHKDSEGRETRSHKQTREAAEAMLKDSNKKATTLSHDDMEKEKHRLLMVFRLFDSNKDGKIDKDELKAVIRSLGKRPTAEKIAKIMEEADKDKSGTIEKDEFINFMVKKQHLKEAKKLKEAAETPKKGRAKKSKVETPKESPNVRRSNRLQEQTKKEKGRKKRDSDEDEDYELEKRKRKTPTKKSPKKKEQEEKEEKEEKKEEEEAPESPKKAATPRKKKAFDRGLSITQFYTPFAGMHDEIQPEERDEYQNPRGRHYDLGHEKAFGIFKVLLFNARLFESTTEKVDIMWDEAKKALVDKGFVVEEAKDEADFLDRIHAFDEAWFISSKAECKDTKRFVSEIKKFHEEGKGLFIWADNQPFFVQANEILKELVGLTLTGNTKGNKILKVGSADKTGEFARHLITTGLVNLHEGNTICYPSKVSKEMVVIAKSTDGNPCVFCFEPEMKGRIVVDCGFTKLLPHHWVKTAGTERYVRNVAVWLLALDYRAKIGAPFQGPLVPQKEEENGKQEEETQKMETEKTSEKPTTTQ